MDVPPDTCVACSQSLSSSGKPNVRVGRDPPCCCLRCAIRLRMQLRGNKGDIFRFLENIQPIPAAIADRNRRFYPNPPNATPLSIFTIDVNSSTVPGFRLIRENDKRQMLMFCDGACINNGRTDVQAQGGCGVAFMTDNEARGGVPALAIKFPLENNAILHSSNRAELRSVIVGLACRFWPGEGFDNIVVAMDSDYVVLGITERIQKWIERGWKTAAGTPVANMDLWMALLDNLRGLEKEGCHVQFWKIPRELNEADKYAKQAASVKLTFIILVVGGGGIDFPTRDWNSC